MKTFSCTRAFWFIIILMSLVPMCSAIKDDRVEINLNIIDSIRKPVPYQGFVEIYFFGDHSETITLKGIVLNWGDENIEKITLDKTLVGLGTEYQKFKNISSMKSQDLLYDAEFKARISKGVHREKIIIDPGKIFYDGFIPNEEKIISVKLSYVYNNKDKVLEDKFPLKILAPIIEPRVGVAQEISIANVPLKTGNYYYGDLHVHTGYSSFLGGYDGDITTGDDCPEYTNPFGPTIPQLRELADILDLNWIFITDHSYCLDNNRFNNIRYWSQQNSDLYTITPFTIIPGEEISVNDILNDGEPFCNAPWDDSVAHLSGNGISSFIPGGVCDNQINAQDGINEVKRLGGFPIINHPSGGDYGYLDLDAWDWENENVEGEAGVEIWNGAAPDEGSVNFWVRRLLGGNKSYAYAGTDAHTGALGAVINGVYIPGNFNYENLIGSLKKGHVFISNEPFLSLKSRIDTNLLMGDTVNLSPGELLQFSVIYNLQSSGRLTIHKGVIGENSEDKETGWPKTYDISNTGETIFSDSPNKDSYYRAHYAATDQSGFIAFTNPMWGLIRIVGDADSDNVITAADALLYLRYAVGQDISPIQLDPVQDDVTCDGAIYADDSLKVLRKAVGQNVNMVCSSLI